MNYRIFVDLSADIDYEIAKKYNIGFIPMNYSIGDEEFSVSEAPTKEEFDNFYQEMKSGKITKTSQITPFQYEEFLVNYAKNGENILYFTLSSGLSNTYNSALVAREELLLEYPDFKFEVVDSLAATGGIGLLAELAIENEKNGMSIEENANIMREYVKKIRHWFYVDDLKYLKRGGRISATSAFLAGALNIKPVLRINEEGKLESISKKHGIKKAQMEIVERFKNEWDGKTNIVYICHSATEDDIKYIVDSIKAINSNIEVRICMLSPIIGCHTGPGIAALCHIGK